MLVGSIDPSVEFLLGQIKLDEQLIIISVLVWERHVSIELAELIEYVLEFLEHIDSILAPLWSIFFIAKLWGDFYSFERIKVRILLDKTTIGSFNSLAIKELFSWVVIWNEVGPITLLDLVSLFRVEFLEVLLSDLSSLIHDIEWCFQKVFLVENLILKREPVGIIC